VSPDPSTIRARAGVLITPTLLLYGTGGFAFGEVKVSGSGAANDVLNCSGGLCVLASFPIISSGAFAFSQNRVDRGRRPRRRSRG
jgi:hypothetical protein